MGYITTAKWGGGKGLRGKGFSKSRRLPRMVGSLTTSEPELLQCNTSGGKMRWVRMGWGGGGGRRTKILFFFFCYNWGNK